MRDSCTGYASIVPKRSFNTSVGYTKLRQMGNFIRYIYKSNCYNELIKDMESHDYKPETNLPQLILNVLPTALPLVLPVPYVDSDGCVSWPLVHVKLIYSLS